MRRVREEEKRERRAGKWTKGDPEVEQERTKRVWSAELCGKEKLGEGKSSSGAGEV